MIQAIVARLSGQSSMVKGWCITLTAALLGFGASTTTPILALLAGYVVAAFAVLDGYYLAIERGYRALYREATRDQTDTWSLEIVRPGVREVTRALRSPGIVLVYGTSLGVTAALSWYLFSR